MGNALHAGRDAAVQLRNTGEQEYLKKLFTTALSLLYRCMEMSKTAEVPEFLLEKWTLVDERVKNTQGCDCDIYWEFIRKWYGFRL